VEREVVRLSESRTCPVCAGAEIRPVFEELWKSLGMILQECVACSLVFQESVTSGGEIGALYGDDYYDHWGVREKFDLVFGLKKRSSRAYLERLLRICPDLAPGARLLDVGCAHGFLLAAAQELGFEAYGIEISPAAEYARTSVGRPVYRDPAELSDMPNGFFSVITMVDVIEHIPWPIEFASCLVGRLLSGGGKVLIVTPNVKSLTARWQQARWPHFKKEHVCYYSPESVRRLFQRWNLRTLHVARSSRFVTLRYVAGHYRRYQGTSVLARALTAAARTAPGSLADFPIRLPSEMIAVGEKRGR
jgi:2-polyprenyl-3-methyl-5-hydroxy-6-metoxy-1,4-benzoquinol methylase